MNSKLISLTGSCLCVMTFAAASTLEEASRVYGSLSSSPTSIQEAGEYIFMQIKWVDDGDASDEEREQNELSAQFSALEHYLTPPKATCTNSPFGRTLTSWMEPMFVVNIPEVRSSVVKNESSGSAYCIVVAFDAAPLRTARETYRKRAEGADMNRWSPDDWKRALITASTNFKTPDERCKFFDLLGCPIVNVVLARSGFAVTHPIPECSEAEKELLKIECSLNATGSYFVGHPNLLFQKTSPGIFYPQWSEDDEGRFSRAVKLFRKGQDLPKILALITESIEINPIGGEKWGYLGGALKLSNRPTDAVIAYLQALRFNSNLEWAWEGLRESCEKGGYPINAKGLGWFLKIRKNIVR